MAESWFRRTARAFVTRTNALITAPHASLLLRSDAGRRPVRFPIFAGIFVRQRRDEALATYLYRVPEPLPLTLYTELLAQMVLLVAALTHVAEQHHPSEDVHAAAAHAQHLAVQRMAEQAHDAAGWLHRN